MMLYYDKLRPGDVVNVTHGANGSRIAQVAKVSPAGVVWVWKFNRAKKCWTKPRQLYPSELIDRLALSDVLDALPPAPALPITRPK